MFERLTGTLLVVVVHVPTDRAANNDAEDGASDRCRSAARAFSDLRTGNTTDHSAQNDTQSLTVTAPITDVFIYIIMAMPR